MAEQTSDEQPNPTAKLLWGMRAAPTRGPKATLSINKIAAAAVAVADAEGIENVSMQRVAESLDFTKMSLYRHINGKADLIAVMIEHAVGEPPDLHRVKGGWRRRLEHWARSMSATWKDHPWLPGVTVGDRVMGPKEMGWVESAMAAVVVCSESASKPAPDHLRRQTPDQTFICRELRQFNPRSFVNHP